MEVKHKICDYNSMMHIKIWILHLQKIWGTLGHVAMEKRYGYLCQKLKLKKTNNKKDIFKKHHSSEGCSYILTKDF